MVRKKYPKHIAKKAAMQIPYSEDGIRDFIIARLFAYVNKTFYNKSLKQNILISPDSITETAQNCRPNRQAAKLALHLPYVLRNANVVKRNLEAMSKKQKNRFKFEEVAILSCNVSGVGIAKVVIGFRDTGVAVEYSVTNFQVLNKTSQFDF